jgi:hypothetical protein
LSLTELSYTQVFGWDSISLVKYREIDPNNTKNDFIIKKSIDLADFYNSDMPYIQYFDNVNELIEKINVINFLDISSNMKKFNIIKKQKVYTLWGDILEEINRSNGIMTINEKTL